MVNRLRPARRFLVADTQLHKSLCPSVGPSVRPSVSTSPAHPSATGIGRVSGLVNMLPQARDLGWADNRGRAALAPSPPGPDQKLPRWPQVYSPVGPACQILSRELVPSVLWVGWVGKATHHLQICRDLLYYVFSLLKLAVSTYK